MPGDVEAALLMRTCLRVVAKCAKEVPQAPGGAGLAAPIADLAVECDAALVVRARLLEVPLGLRHDPEIPLSAGLR